MSRLDVIVIGGGQAGLSIGYQLSRRRLRYRILEAASVPGASWRSRWDSLRLFTPARYSALPGMAFPGDPDALPTGDEVASYLTAYIDCMGLPVSYGERVERVESIPGGYRVTTSARHWEAAQVVVATGPFQKGDVPALAKRIAPEVVQVHSSAYRNPDQLPEGDILVVGGGNSGVQIAEELSRSRAVTLAVGQKLLRLPQNFLGRSVFWWLERSGAMNVRAESRLGRKVRGRELLIGRGPADLARHGVRVTGRVTSADDGSVHVENGAPLRPAAVVWATGFRSDYSWLKVPVISPSGAPAHQDGVTAASGLYFLGLPWQSTRGSALIGWVGRDASALAERILHRHGEGQSGTKPMQLVGSRSG